MTRPSYVVELGAWGSASQTMRKEPQTSQLCHLSDEGAIVARECRHGAGWRCRVVGSSRRVRGGHLTLTNLKRGLVSAARREPKWRLGSTQPLRLLRWRPWALAALSAVVLAAVAIALPGRGGRVWSSCLRCWRRAARFRTSATRCAVLLSRSRTRCMWRALHGSRRAADPGPGSHRAAPAAIAPPEVSIVPENRSLS
jgi:hypothetical protein